MMRISCLILVLGCGMISARSYWEPPTLQNLWVDMLSAAEAVEAEKRPYPDILDAQQEELVAAISRFRSSPFDKTKIRCYNCTKYGHFKNECKGTSLSVASITVHFRKKLHNHSIPSSNKEDATKGNPGGRRQLRVTSKEDKQRLTFSSVTCYELLGSHVCLFCSL